MLTTKCSFCLHLTPLSRFNSRPCSHSNIVFSTSIQCRQNGRGCRIRGGGLTAPKGSPMLFVLHVVHRDGRITLWSGPVHSQTWSPLSDCLGQRHTSHLGRALWIECCREMMNNGYQFMVCPWMHVHVLLCIINYTNRIYTNNRMHNYIFGLVPRPNCVCNDSRPSH